MQQVVLKLSYHDDRTKKKVMRAVSGHSGIESLAMDSANMKLTVTGDIDAVSLVSKLRKICTADILSVGPKKKEEPKKEEPKKEEPKKVNEKEELTKILQTYKDYYSRYPTPAPAQYYARSVEEDPNGCVIC